MNGPFRSNRSSTPGPIGEPHRSLSERIVPEVSESLVMIEPRSRLPVQLGQARYMVLVRVGNDQVRPGNAPGLKHCCWGEASRFVRSAVEQDVLSIVSRHQCARAARHVKDLDQHAMSPARE